MQNKKYFDRNGKPIILLTELGKGGEGSVYEILGRQDLVAKIYFTPPSLEKSTKIMTMAEIANDRLLKLSAWPTLSLHSAQGTLTGFCMPKLSSHKPLYELYGPKLRLQEFPKADWRFLIHAAINTARAFLIIHEEGHVIGDVNHGNLFVAPNATVKFIDTDSFQISTKGKKWLCDVGVGTHQPPEMQGLSSYQGIIRSENHDNFGLAVLIFQLLCLGRHPFSGKFLGKGDMPIEKAITEHRFAYLENHHITQMMPPPACLQMSSLTPNLRKLFEQAFSKFGKTSRPKPLEWIAALEELLSKLQKCVLHNGHYYLQNLPSCPWCHVESSCHFTLFPIIGSLSNLSHFNISSFWQQVLKIKDPGPPPPLPKTNSYSSKPTSEAMNLSKKIKKMKLAFIISGLLLIILTILLPILFLGNVLLLSTICFGYTLLHKRWTLKIKTEFDLAKKKWDDFLTFWMHSEMNSLFRRTLNKLEHLKKNYTYLPKEREEKLKQLTSNQYKQQLDQFLNSYRIASAKIEGIGASRLAVLQSFGIETAADVNSKNLLSINGFGPILVGRLVNWKRFCEGNFVFNASKGISSLDTSKIDHEIFKKRQQLEIELTKGLTELAVISNQVSAKREALYRQVPDILKQLAQAQADAKAVSIRHLA